MDNILVLGGTGFVGRAVCEKLVERYGGGGGAHHGADAAPGARPRDIRRCRRWSWCRPTCTTTRSWQRWCAGATAVINLVAILHGSEAEFERVHVELPRALARACAAPACGAWCMSARSAPTPTRRRCTCAARPPAKRCCATPRWT